MIPILYSASETDFNTNGLGALSDVSECKVTEERNGSYELEMQYPVKGRHYSDIVLDAIIYARPADGKDPQPFQIYKISTPINDIVTISAQHISYRLSFVPVGPLTITGASAALNALKSNSIIDHPFTVWTDMDNTTSKYSRDYPSSFRECLGGTDGSFLDVFGGEIEWDKFTVKFHKHRGSDNGVRIAYSKNLTDFTNEEANDGVITAVYPYWTDSETSEVVTCGIVYGIKDFGYTKLTTQDPIPSWVENTYYKIKTSGYYQNDEDFAPDWSENKYYYVKPSGYYNVEGDAAPTWETDKYYSRLPYGFFNVEGETAPEFAYDTYYEIAEFMYVKLSEDSVPEWKADTYYDSNYELTTEQPDDWNTNYNNYYIKEPSEFELLTSKPYDWAENYFSYYFYVEPKYVVTTQEPTNWSTEYKSYFVHYEKDDSNPIYILTTAEPIDWHENYNSYYVYYEQVEGVVDYTLTTSMPDDWDANYTNYFTYWEKRYNDDYPFSRIVTLDCSSDIDGRPNERQLRRVASDYINSTSLTKKSISLNVSFVALWQTEEYKDIAPLERVNLCDTVLVDLKSENNTNSVKLKVIKTVYDVLAERYESIELGEPKSSLSSTISNVSSAISEAVMETKSSLRASIDHQVDLMNGALGGNVKINYNSKGLPCEIIIGDSDDISKMVNCLRINYRGVGFSKNGYAGPYTSVWGLDGEFDGQCIKAGSIEGSSIKAGTIEASSFTSAAKDSLLSEVTETLSTIESAVGSNSNAIAELNGWLHVRNGKLYIGEEGSSILLRAENDKISFIDTSTDPPTELAYISNNRFYTNELMLGGYKVVASMNANEGLTFRWAETVNDSN